MKKYILFILFSSILFSLVPASGAEVRISVTASMRDAFREIIAVFTDSHPEMTLLANIASSGSLVKQIVQGAPVDIFVSANSNWMVYLVDRKQILPDTVQIIARNTLVFVGSKRTDIRGMKDITALSRIAMGSAKNVPAGQYAAQAMQAIGIHDQLTAAHKLVMAKDVRQALLYADRGEVDGAFVYQTDALLARNAVILFSVPEHLHDPVVYSAGMTPAGMEKRAVRIFFAYLQGTAASTILSKHGFKPTSTP